MDHFFNSFYGATQSTSAQLFEKYAGTSAPLMLLGEPGTGAEQMARFIYSRSPLQHAPICEVDCALLQKKGCKCCCDESCDCDETDECACEEAPAEEAPAEEAPAEEAAPEA